jgi:hypothetical protein
MEKGVKANNPMPEEMDLQQGGGKGGMPTP